MAENNEIPDYTEFVKKYLWLIRPCDDYEREARECQNFKARFHQYFIHGTFIDCNAWLRDVQNCEQCIIQHNSSACTEIIKNESERRLKRGKDHEKNDVWEKREKPPEDWNKELPEWWLKENKASIFKDIKDEFEEFIACNEPKKPSSLCVIL